MKKFKNWLIKRFTGIYGIDNLYLVMMGVLMALMIVNIFIRHWVFWIIYILILGYMLFRAMSHNKTARRRENDAFFNFFRKIGRFFKLQKNRFYDRKTHIYRKCPKCKAVIRLPKAKGKHLVVCPRCKNSFSVKG